MIAVPKPSQGDDPPRPTHQQLSSAAAHLADRWARRRATAVVAGVVAMVAASAAAYGGVTASLQPTLFAGAMALGVLAVFGRIGRAGPALAVLGGFAALTALQLAPLPMAAVEALSPQRAETAATLTDGALQWLSLSYYSPETRRGLGRLLMGIAVFAAVALGLNSTRSVKWLLGGLFAVGIAEACLAIVQLATDAPGVYWDESVRNGAWVGSFVNHSNFSQLLNLSIGAGIGLLLIQSSEERRSHSKRKPTGPTAYLQRHGGLLLGVAVQVVAICLSLSRGGVLGALVGGVLVAIALGRERSLGPRSWALLLVPLLAFAGLAAVGFDVVYDRLGTLHSQDAYTDRVQLTKDTLNAGLDHPMFGTGLDTHRYAFTPYDTTGSIALAEQADNDYAQLFEEMGAAGCLLVLGFLVLVGRTGWRVVSSARSPVRYAAYGTLYGLAACAVQSVTDFGQRLPAVFCASAALAGVVFAVRNVNSQRLPRSGSFGLGRWAGAVVVVAVGGWFGHQSWLDHQAEQWWSIALANEELLLDEEWAAPPEVFADLLAAAEQAAATRPNEIEYAFWLNAYRWQAFTVGTVPSELVQEPAAREVATRLVEEFQHARTLCPTFGPTHTLEGEVRTALGDPAGRELIEAGVRLAPNDPNACFAAAVAAATALPPEEERAAGYLSRCVRLDPRLFREAAAFWLDAFGDVAWPREEASGDAGRLRELADQLDRRGGNEALANELKAESDALLEARVAAGDASPGQLAAMAASRANEGKIEQAIELYRKALASQYSNFNWRLALCDVLTTAGRYHEAHREARLCLRLKPLSKQARERLEQLSLLIPPDVDQ